MPLIKIGIHIPVLSHFRKQTRAARPGKSKRRAALPAAGQPSVDRCPPPRTAQPPNYGSRLTTAAPSLSSASRRTERGHAAFIR